MQTNLEAISFYIKYQKSLSVCHKHRPVPMYANKTPLSQMIFSGNTRHIQSLLQIAALSNESKAAAESMQKQVSVDCKYLKSYSGALLNINICSAQPRLISDRLGASVAFYCLNLVEAKISPDMSSRF